ncbi:MAG: hypothetical protein MUE96_10095 [Bacteroidia bacterium]|jgi:RHS repeat-associated protein|nr:hypothetical protein [Bacteroidia bacterium]
MFNYKETLNKVLVAQNQFNTSAELNDWTATNGTRTFANNSLQYSTTNSTASVSRNFTTQTSKTYRLTFTVDVGNAGTIGLAILGYNGTAIVSGSIGQSGVQQLDFVANSTSTTLRVTINTGSGTRTLYLDNIKLEEITGDLAGYRFGFNGKENDDETYGTGNEYDYGFRIYNPRLGKFLSTDPLEKEYPFYTPYQFASNTPIMAVDVDGLESQTAIDGTKREGPFNMNVINKEIQTNRNNQQQAAMKKDALIKDIARRNSATNNTEQPVIKLSSSVEAGLIAGLQIKVLGVGVGGTAGVSQPLISSTISEQGGENEVGGEPKFNGSYAYGIAQMGTSIDTKGTATVDGSLSVVNGSASTDASSSTEIELFSITAGTFVTGNISLSIDLSSMGSRQAMPSPNITGFAPTDNTSVSKNAGSYSLPATQQIIKELQ